MLNHCSTNFLENKRLKLYIWKQFTMTLTLKLKLAEKHFCRDMMIACSPIQFVWDVGHTHCKYAQIAEDRMAAFREPARIDHWYVAHRSTISQQKNSTSYYFMLADNFFPEAHVQFLEKRSFVWM